MKMNWLKNLQIHGYRGFGEPEKINFAIPTGERGSGITVIVGPNNAGKSTIIESLKAISRPPNKPPSFTEGKRNKQAGDKVSFLIENSEGQQKKLATIEQGGSETSWTSPDIEPQHSRIFVLPSRRTFSPYFKKGSQTRTQYIDSTDLAPTRGTPLNFGYRLFEIQKNPAEFNALIDKIIKRVPDWYIEQSDPGQYYLKFRTGDEYHNSDGMGEGLVSLFFIIDALYDSKEGDIIVVDEPELSLHPHFQKGLRNLFCDFARNRQIVFATHSPYFIDWHAISSGASIIRVRQTDNRSTVHEMLDDTKQEIKGLLRDLNNPHVLGLDASEVFFFDDNVILVEGQEDVIFFPKVLNELKLDLNGSFFGWGVGGASKMKLIAQILNELGFEKVVGILDNNMSPLKTELEVAYPHYLFKVISADDVRTKQALDARQAIIGLLDETGALREHYRAKTYKLFLSVKSWLES
jgi:predicted ATP-dependent endonuclease of OLD family